MKITDLEKFNFPAFAAALGALAASLPPSVRCAIEQGEDYVSLKVDAPSSDHRQLIVDATPDEIEYRLGRLWGELIWPDPASAAEILAMCDTVCERGFREVRDRRTGVFHHVMRVSTRGLYGYRKDSDFSLWHWLRLKVERVRITTIPPLLLPS